MVYKPQTNNGIVDNDDKDQSATNPALSEAELSALTDDDLRRMCRESLVLMIHGNKGKLVSSGAIRELLDRMDGKPAQSIAMTVKTDPISKLSDERLLRLERSLAQMTGEDAIVIAPLPGKLED